jgi:hypothetical protein
MPPAPVDAFFLPKALLADVKDFTALEFGSEGERVTLRAPIVTQELISKTASHLKAARENFLSRLGVGEILEKLNRVLDAWGDPDYPLRRQAESLLPVVTGFSPPMIRQGLEILLSSLRGENLSRLLEDEMGDPLTLDGFRPRRSGRGKCRAFGPPLTTHIFSGNIPGVPAFSLLCALLAKSACLGKSASEEPLFPVLFARSIAEMEPELGDCLAVLLWKGGDRDIEGKAFSSSDAVIVYGSDEAVESVRRRVPSSVRFIGYGHKLSFGCIGREALSKSRVQETAGRAALDASVFDQQGCLSPHLFYVEEGGETTAREFAGILARAMDAFHREIPRGRISPEASAAINQLRGDYEFREMAEEGVDLHVSSPGTEWTVIYEEDAAFAPSCLNRTLRVKPVRDAADVPGLLEPVRRYLQTAGVSLPESRLMPLGEALGFLGVDRVCPLGRMANPTPEWHHDGRFNILDLLRWTDMEEPTG